MKAEEHRQKGNDLFKEGAFPAALKEYEEGIKRDPKAVAIYSNRCATYIKLMEFATALKDADKCLDLDSKFVKAYARKGTCHHFLKEYHKALKADFITYHQLSVKKRFFYPKNPFKRPYTQQFELTTHVSF